MRKYTNDFEKELIQKQMNMHEEKRKAIEREIEYLYLQEGFCYDKLRESRASKNEVKEKYWLQLIDKCEKKRFPLQDEVDKHHEDYMSLNKRMIELLTDNLKELQIT